MKPFHEWAVEVDREIIERTGLEKNLITAPYAELHHQGFTVMQAVAHALGYPYLPREEKITRMALAMARFEAAATGHALHDRVTLDALDGSGHYRKLAEVALGALGQYGGEF